MLNIKNYFDTNNRYLTRSKISQFFVCKNYFYRLHIEGSIKPKGKDCFVTGSAVDSLLAQIENKDNYYVCQHDGRTKLGKEEREMAEANGSIIISQNDYENILALAIAVEQTDAYQSLKDHTRQMLLQMPWTFSNGLFDGVASLPDFIKITGKHADVADLKTTAKFDIKHWFYTCKDYNYYDQFALTQLILETQGIETFSFKHLIVEKTADINSVFAVHIPNDLVSVDQLINKITIISNTTNFDKYNPSWERALVLRDPKEGFEDL